MERKNIENFDEIKVRLLQFAEMQGIAKTLFFQKIEMNPSNFSGNGGKSALKSDNIVKVLTTFSELNPDWLLLGKGNMLRSNESTVNFFVERFEQLVLENDRLKKEIERLRGI